MVISADLGLPGGRPAISPLALAIGPVGTRRPSAIVTIVCTFPYMTGIGDRSAFIVDDDAGDRPARRRTEERGR